MRTHSTTLMPQGCPKCYKIAICDAALHDFEGVEMVALRCPTCANIWRAPNGIQVRNPDGTLVVIGADGDRVRAYAEPL